MTWRKNAATYENKPKTFKSGEKQMNKKKKTVHKFLVLQELGATK